MEDVSYGVSVKWRTTQFALPYTNLGNLSQYNFSTSFEFTRAKFIFSLFIFVEAFEWIPLVPAVLVFIVTVLPVTYFGEDIPKIVIAFLQEIIPWVKGIVEAIKASHNNKD